jgi:dihydroflavonol-4-reductase
MPSYVDTGLCVADVRDVAAGHLLAALKGRIGERYILGGENMTLRSFFDGIRASILVLQRFGAMPKGEVGRGPRTLAA